MHRHLFITKIHRATVTQADLDYVGSITIDADLLDAAGMLPGEKIDIYNITNGNRLSTYTIPGPRGSGVVGINGAAAHHVSPGDLVILCAYAWVPEAEARTVTPTVVLVDAANRVTSVKKGGPSVTAFADPHAAGS